MLIIGTVFYLSENIPDPSSTNSYFLFKIKCKMKGNINYGISNTLLFYRFCSLIQNILKLFVEALLTI